MNELYLVIEIQKVNEQISNIVTSHNTLQDAEHKFYTIVAAAAISTIEKHGAVLLNEDGFPLERMVFEHKE